MGRKGIEEWDGYILPMKHSQHMEVEGTESLRHLFVDGTDNLRPSYCTYCGTSDPEEFGEKCNSHFTRGQIGRALPDWLSYLGPCEGPYYGQPGYENHADQVYNKRYRWNRSQKKWVAR